MTYGRYEIRDQRGGEHSSHLIATDVGDPVGHIASRVADFVRDHLAERRAYALGKSHGGLKITPMTSTTYGVHVEDFCESRPCSWLGDAADNIEPREVSKTIYTIWAVEPEKEPT